jgi:cell division protein FtsL
MEANQRPQPTSDNRELRFSRVGRALTVTFVVAVLVACGVFYGLV